MSPRRSSAVIAGATLTGILVVAAPSHAGPPGNWTVISGAGVSNIVEPGMYRTSDGTLHVAIEGTTNSQDSIEVAHVSASGALTGRNSAVPSWSGTTSDPDLVGAPGGGMRLVFGGHRTTVTGDPYNEGYVYSASSDGAGANWTLAPNTAPAVASGTGYVSSGTGVTTLADGTLVTAYPFNDTIFYQVGSAAVQSFDVPPCCAYDMSLAVDGSGAVYAAWYSNGSSGIHGTLVRQIHPTLGPIMQAPGGIEANDQAIAMVARPDGGIYLAYPRGDLNKQGYGLWRIGTGTVRTVPGSKGADHLAMSLAPGGPQTSRGPVQPGGHEVRCRAEDRDAQGLDHLPGRHRGRHRTRRRAHQRRDQDLAPAGARGAERQGEPEEVEAGQGRRREVHRHRRR
jgi:hypothetical protein